MTTTTDQIRTTCAACGVILEPGSLDEDGRTSSGICPPCLARLYGELGAEVAAGSSHEDPRRRRAIAERRAQLEGEAGLELWTREEEGALWIRIETADGPELVRAELLARDAGGNWYVLTVRLESRSFAADEVVGSSLEA